MDELLTRAAAASLNLEERTVDVIFSTGAGVKRRGVDGPFLEVLSMDPAHIRLDRFNSGASLLDSHDAYSMASRLGSIVPGSAKVRGGKGVATVRFSTSALADTLLRDLAAGHRLQVSVGYRIHSALREEGEGDQLPTIRAVDWEPLELSAVTVPADPGAFSRGDPAMPGTTTTTTTPPLAPDAADLTAIERQRSTSISALGRQARMGATVIERAIADGTAVEDFRARAFDHMARESNRMPAIDLRGEDDHHDVREAAVVGIAALLGAPPKTGSPDEMVGRSVVEIGRSYMASRGIDLSGQRDRDVVNLLLGGQGRGLHTTSDFPMLFEDGAQRALLERFKANPTVLKAFSRQRNAKDFRPQSFIRPGEAPDLEKVNEHGEIKSGTFRIEKNGFQIFTFAKMFGLTRQALINDDLGAVEDFVSAFLDTAIRREAIEFYALLSANNFGGAKMGDGKNFFHADHGNLATTPAAITVESVSAGEKAMRSQRNVNGSDLAGSAPTVLLVGPERALVARQFVAEFAAASNAEVNPYAATLSVAIENRYPGTGWWLLAGPRRPTFIHGYLDGAEGPDVQIQEGWTILGREYRCVLDFGANVYDPRSAYFNPGM